MKLLTLNCHSWREENQLDKIKYLAKIIHENQYDVIALQEVSQHIESSFVNDKIRTDNFVYVLLSELRAIGDSKYDYVWDFAHLGYDVYEEGVSIITKHPIINKESFYVSRSSSKHFWKSRKLVKTTISIDGKEADFISCHLGWWQDEEEPFNEQVDKLLEKINGDRTTFLMGDFNNNASVRKQGYDYLLSKGMFDTYDMADDRDEGITVKGDIDGWEENEEKLRLDLILCTKKIKVKSSKVIFNEKNKKIISDHYGLEVIVQKI